MGGTNLEKCAIVGGIHFRTVNHEVAVLVAIDHIVVESALLWARVDVVHFIFGIFQRRLDVFHAHVDETADIAHEPSANQAQQWPNVAFHFLFRHTNAQLGQCIGQRRIHVAHHLREQLVQRLQNEFDETPLRRIVRRFLREFAAAGIFRF